MIDRRRRFIHLVGLAAFMAILLRASALRAQEANARGAAEPVVQQGAWTDRQFDDWIDQIVSGINNRDTPVGGQLDERLLLKLDWIQASCGISEEQKKKLLIAGRRDIKRFLDELRATKRQYRQIKADPIEFARVEKRLAEIQTSSAEELFGEASFLSKMLDRTLSETQRMAYRKAVEESQVFAHRAAVEQAVQFCDMAIGLTADQRRRLIELFMDEAPRVSRKDTSELSLQFLMLLQTAKLSREKLRTIFDKQQWEVMSALLKQLEKGVNAVGFGAIQPPIKFDLVIERTVLDSADLEHAGRLPPQLND
jgi:hypothetical protein